MKAIWNGKVLAESADTIMIEGNHYFPKEAVNPKYIEPSDTHTVCHWKGTASYYDIKVRGQINHDAAWYYPKTSDLAAGIENRVAFWKGVEIMK